jgi:hypothetical protein
VARRYTPPGTAVAHSGRVRLARPSEPRIVLPGKIIGTYQVGRSPLWTLLEPLTLIMHGKLIGTYRNDGAVRR